MAGQAADETDIFHIFLCIILAINKNIKSIILTFLNQNIHLLIIEIKT